MGQMDADLKKKILQKFVDENRSSLSDHEKCKQLHQKLLDELNAIKAQLDLENDESTIKQTVDKLDSTVESINGSLDESETLTKEIEQNLDELDAMRKDVQKKMNDLHETETAVQYMKVVQRVEALSADLEKEYNGKDDESCITLFVNLCEISRNLIDSTACHLKGYVKETIIYWHKILRDKLVVDFDEVLKALKWPFVSENFSLQTPSQANIQKLQLLAEYLLQIELPDESLSPVITSALLSDFPPLCLPINYLVVPLKKRFIYHFYGGRQTNRVDKPEWYFTQILSWTRDHIDFVSKWIQPVIDKLGLHHIDAKLEFMRGLVQLAVEKLHSELPNLQFDDFTFSHCIDEALGFDKELRETYSYPSTQPSILAVLTQAQVFVKWLAMEKKYAIEKMDAMLSPTAMDIFEPLITEGDELKVSSCADTFITLLQTITERYESLPQPGHRLQFLELQLDLLDDFRIRLLQLVNAEEGDVVESRIPMIANTAHYVEDVLMDWGAMLHYLGLFYYKSQLDEVVTGNPIPVMDYDGSPDFEMETETVFADTLSLFRHMRKDLLCTLSESVNREAKMRSRDYRHERWSAMVYHKDMRTLSLTPSACPMFEVLARRLHQLQKSLAKKLFTIVWRFVAQQLDIYLFEDLILENRFNDGGAIQLKYDMQRNLFPLFSQFSEKPENYFTQVKESCELLNISKGSALLLRETLLALEGATGVEDRRGQALKEVGVTNFTPQMSVDILNRRTDITVNRMVID